MNNNTFILEWKMGKSLVSGATFKSVVPCWRSWNKLLCQSQTSETQLCFLEWRVLEMPPIFSHYPKFLKLHWHLHRNTINSHLDVNMRGCQCKNAQEFDKWDSTGFSSYNLDCIMSWDCMPSLLLDCITWRIFLEGIVGKMYVSALHLSFCLLFWI